MIVLFLILTIINLICLLGTAVLGYGNSVADDWGGYHQLAGALATICACAVHCVVFTYFIATAKWVQYAVSVKRLDPALATPTRSFRAQAFPAALLAMATVILTAFVGAAADNYHGRWHAWHHGLAIAALATNVLVALVEYRAIDRNARLIDGVLARIGAAATA